MVRVIGVKTHPDLVLGDLFRGQWGQLVQRKVSAVHRLQIGLEGAAYQVAQDKNFADAAPGRKRGIYFWAGAVQ